MNAAARLVHQNVLSRHLVFTHSLTWRQIMPILLGAAILSSAFSIIYVTHLTRMMYSSYQHNLKEQSQLFADRSQLLLERSAWMMQSKTQQIAENELDMIVPDHKSVVMIRE